MFTEPRDIHTHLYHLDPLDTQHFHVIHEVKLLIKEKIRLEACLVVPVTPVVEWHWGNCPQAIRRSDFLWIMRPVGQVFDVIVFPWPPIDDASCDQRDWSRVPSFFHKSACAGRFQVRFHCIWWQALLFPIIYAPYLGPTQRKHHFFDATYLVHSSFLCEDSYLSFWANVLVLKVCYFVTVAPDCPCRLWWLSGFICYAFHRLWTYK